MLSWCFDFYEFGVNNIVRLLNNWIFKNSIGLGKHRLYLK